MPFSRTTTLARFTRRTAVALAAAPLLLGACGGADAGFLGHAGGGSEHLRNLVDIGGDEACHHRQGVHVR